MTDIFEKEKRSWIMSKVSGKNTKPELIVRKILWNLGFRYRLHIEKLPGKPDIVFSKWKKAIFVNGCFWHGHENCKLADRPKSNNEYWEKKINRNIERDKNNIKVLEVEGWEVLVVWECELKDRDKLIQRLRDFLMGGNLYEKEG